jgi:hypothetical protein
MTIDLSENCCIIILDVGQRKAESVIPLTSRDRMGTAHSAAKQEMAPGVIERGGYYEK